ncbi:YkgJ family cysteine cluster protein [Silvibacterium dinghuense]|uniref:YkgJ family cysteine cluster protein n=1 Tax=Silvibacterium dinghuense TaxID=1560006 RepID=A0A4Q1SGG5_9BACT|nr:YkgJ family cysteine cluster protein [Silvibacterium dinghuense]RXS96606.1 YkgJ family cysteine cluster protein [Silvibacterium dinghuense]GGG92180.1 hypothetical protein GCM10011586_03560 [Silvibacterium dinghuense]
MPNDTQLVQIVADAFTDAARRSSSMSGSWLPCHLGCNQCCIGVFPISALDAQRLRDGITALEHDDPERAARVHERATRSRERLTPHFPGDPETGILREDDAANEAFEDFANDEPCPALDPATGGCDLYAARPMTCRIFGPPVRSAEGIGVCELCFVGAPQEDILAAELDTSWSPLEDELNAQAELDSGQHGSTLVAFVLAPRSHNSSSSL